MIPAVIYAAKSTEDVHGSIPDQLADGQALATRRDLEVMAEFQDEAASAYHGDRGPGLAGALAACERLSAEHGSCALVVQHSDRLARGDAKQARHLIEIVLWAIKHDVELLSVQDPEILAGGDMALLLGAIGGMRNHQDSKRKSLSVTDGHRRRAVERGQFVGRAPYGYRFEDKVLVVEPGEAEIVKRIFRDYCNGVGQRAIVRSLNEDRVPTRYSGPWHQSRVTKILNAVVYVGKLDFKNEILPGAHEAIVGEEVWRKAEAIRTDAYRRKGGRHPDGAHLLTRGILKCSCGAAMIPRKARPGVERERYVCSGRIAAPESCWQPSIRRELIDTAFLAQLLNGHADLVAMVKRIEGAAVSELEAAREAENHAEGEVVRLERALAQTERDYDAGDITGRQYSTREARLTEELEGAGTRSTGRRNTLKRSSRPGQSATPSKPFSTTWRRSSGP